MIVRANIAPPPHIIYRVKLSLLLEWKDNVNIVLLGLGFDNYFRCVPVVLPDIVSNQPV